MRGNEFLDKMELVDPAYVKTAAETPKKRKNVWIKWGAAAACLCITVVGIILWRLAAPSRSEVPGPAVSENGVTIPTPDASLSAGTMADIAVSFIYQGRQYFYYDSIYDDVNLVGEYLGTTTATGLEWTPEDGNVELTGRVSGDIYTVKGYDPSFMLCMKGLNDTGFYTFICNDGITLKYGSELYEDRLHLSGNIASVQYESRDSWDHGRGERYQMNSVNDTVLDFIKHMDAAQFVLCDSVPLIFNKTALYYLRFQKKDGTTVRLSLYENGYVRFDGIWELCVQVPEESYSVLLNLLDNLEDSTAVK